LVIGGVFNERYTSIIVDTDAYLMQVCRYIHLNPVTAGLVKKAQHYRWSSAPDYIMKTRNDWLKTDFLIDQTPDFNRYTHDGNKKKILSIYSKQKLPTVLTKKA
jgi:hypothetical protein